MNLLTKYNRLNILATIGVLITGGVCYYVILHFVLIKQLDKDLIIEEQEIFKYVSMHAALPDNSNLNDQRISFEKTVSPVKRSINSINRYSDRENETEKYRQLTFPVHLSGKYYKVSVSKSQQETEDLVQLIVSITIALVVLLLVALFIINRFFFNKLWLPFNNTLLELKRFNLISGKTLNLQQTNINEFKELNDAVALMSSRVVNEYESIKGFTENASHEIQTPLAIINSKLDVLIQDETLSEFQMKQLQAVYDALDRISSLNQSLLLLTKIDNNQFPENEKIAVDHLIEEKLVQFAELAEDKKLVIHRDIHPAIVFGNQQLLDILFSNLLSNAIRYNIVGGCISVKVRQQEVCISNDSFLGPLDEAHVFQRFYRHADTRQEGNGLGLSIARQVCTLAGYAIKYSHRDQHIFTVSFAKT